MDFGAAFIIRAGSAALFVVLGAVVGFLGRRKPGPVALSLFLIVFGLKTIWNNLMEQSGTVWTIGDIAFAIPMFAGAIAVAVLVPARLSRNERLALSLGMIPGAVGFAGLLALPGGLDAYREIQHISPALALLDLLAAFLFVFGPLALPFISSWRIALHPPADRPGWIRSAAPVVLLGPYMVWLAPTYFVQAPAGWILAFGLAVVIGLAVPWLIAATRTGRRLPVVMALLWPALGLATFACRLVPNNGPHVASDFLGVFGVLRLVGWLFLVYAIVRADLLGVSLPRLAVSRGVLAASALATLFIVAQVMQNFLSAQYGLLTGGVVAGAFLFAANPVQRRVERMGERTAAGVSAPATFSTSGHDAFRAAVRAALADGVMTGAEEEHLADVAHHLALSPRDALRLRRDIQREFGQKVN